MQGHLNIVTADRGRPFSDVRDAMADEAQVIIVGGGAAGISAARLLSAHGIPTLLLEASSRLGGRAMTHEVGGYPLDFGCGWLHSGDRNPWTDIAEASGFEVERRVPTRGGTCANAVFTEDEQAEARRALAAWGERLHGVAGAGDRASDALEPGGRWNGFVRAVAGFMSGAAPERISAADYIAYEAASTGRNWRVPFGYGALVAASLPASVGLRMATPVERIDLVQDGVAVTTRAGTVRARAAILTVSTTVLAGDTIVLPSGLDPWREAAAELPLGRNEKIFLEIAGPAFEPETHVFGDLRAPGTAAYTIRPFGRPVVECFLGDEGAGLLQAEGPAAGFSQALAELKALFGNRVASSLRPLAASAWGREARIGGAYSCALPGCRGARAILARPFADRIFFAGEATHAFDFSTAHGAFESGRRAAAEVLATIGSMMPRMNPTDRGLDPGAVG